MQLWVCSSCSPLLYLLPCFLGLLVSLQRDWIVAGYEAYRLPAKQAFSCETCRSGVHRVTRGPVRVARFLMTAEIVAVPSIAMHGRNLPCCLHYLPLISRICQTTVRECSKRATG